MRFPHGQEIIVASFELKFKQWGWIKVYLIKIYFDCRSDRTSELTIMSRKGDESRMTILGCWMSDGLIEIENAM